MIAAAKQWRTGNRAIANLRLSIACDSIKRATVPDLLPQVVPIVKERNPGGALEKMRRSIFEDEYRIVKETFL